MEWWYDPRLSYQDNADSGPSGPFATVPPPPASTPPSAQFLGTPVHSPFGIPAGPLVNARFCAAAFAWGFDVNVYKTVRSRATPAHAHPNVLRVNVDGPLGHDRAMQGLLADDDYARARSISNSFGVPSQDPDAWQPDVAAAVASARPGQLLIASFQGTRGGTEERWITDHATTARLAVETGARVLELNLSCPNEGTGDLLCFDTATVSRIVHTVRDAIGDVPLVLKLAHFTSADALAELVRTTHRSVAGYAAINTIPARLVTRDGRQALPGAGRAVAGVCGASITWAAFEMVERLARLRDELSADFAIVGVGGVMAAPDAVRLRAAGADAVMSATGAMLDPWLGMAVRASA
ncbi:tRNA-dihydrouridine synthase [uncultured Demequina sp.]|uniref:tRNA-dihydrouridine synthase n=1 Tax=uncultured Demequina sp. TaxID=693499 RepID=UPI0025CBBB14|nr:tRNA-dihydrouridine synthase [uncultured Demequina sp.]